VVQHGFGNADTGYAGDRIASAVNMTYRTRFGRPATASTWPAQTALSTRLPIDHRSSIQVGLSIDCFAHRVALAPPRAGRTTFLRQVGRPSRSIASTTPCAPLNTNRSVAFVCPFRVSARSSLPTRTGHTKAAPSHRAGHRRGKLRASSAVCSAVRTICPVPPNVGPVQIAALPHSHLSMRSAIQTGARCSIRPVRGAYRADLAPGGFNTAPSQRAGDRRSNRYATPCHGTCFERPGSTPRLRFAAFGLHIDTLWTQALQRAVRIAAYCSFTGQ
jgi:hypothetical protein